MARPTLVIVDDFYDDPAAVRRLALSLPYRQKPGATYPGKEAIAIGVDWSPVRSTLASFIQEPVTGNGRKEPAFVQGKFRLAMAEDDASRIDRVHQDEQAWSAVVYLSRPEDCEGQGAVAFYRHKPTGATAAAAAWYASVFGELDVQRSAEDRDRFWAHMRDTSVWQEEQRVVMRHNRALLLQAQCFHASIGLFGRSPETGRLTQHFEFYYPGDLLASLTDEARGA